MTNRRARWLAAAAPLVWLLCAWAARRIGFWPALGGAAVALGVLAAVVDRDLLARLVPRGRVLRSVLLGVTSGAVMAVAAWALYPAAVAAAPWIARDTAGLYRSFAALSYGQAAIALPPIILSEELIWRGLLANAWAPRMRPAVAVAIGALAYALANVPTGSPVLVLAAYACGLVWHTLRITTGGLLAPVLSHLVWDVLVLFVHPTVPT